MRKQSGQHEGNDTRPLGRANSFPTRRSQPVANDASPGIQRRPVSHRPRPNDNNATALPNHCPLPRRHPLEGAPTLPGLPPAEVVHIPLVPTIPISVAHLLLAMQRHLSQEDRGAWDHFTLHLRIVIAHYYTRLLHSAADVWDLLQDSGQERQLYRPLTALLDKAGYCPLSAALYSECSSDFSHLNEERTAWQRPGPDHLLSYVQKTGLYTPDQLPPFAAHALVFTRGAGLEELEGRHLSKKFEFLWNVLSTGGWAFLHQMLNESVEKPFVPPSTATSCVVQRRSLASQLKDMGFWQWLTSSFAIREPTFESVVIFHPGHGSASAQLDLYEKVPLADLPTLLLPSEAAHLTQFDLIKHGIICGSAALLTVLMFVAGGLVGLLLLPWLLGGFLAVLSHAARVPQEKVRQMGQWRQRKRTATGTSALAVLASDATAEDTRRLLLAYFILWQHGPQSVEALERSMALFVKDEFDKTIAPPGECISCQLEWLGLVNTTTSASSDKVEISGSPQQILPRFDGLQVLHDVRLL